MGGPNNQDSAPPSTRVDPPRSKARLYQVWKGRNKFLCGGRLIFGPDVASVVLTTLLIGAPALTFCITWLLRIPKVNSLYGHVVLVVGFVLTVLDLTFLYMTAARNPGIVPRNSRPPDSDSASDSMGSMEWINSASPDLKLPRTKDVVVNGHMVKVKFCDTCLLYRPPRASHCSICNNCVQRFDHHCPWVGQCIGVRNYWAFFLFVLTSTVLCIYVFTFSLLNLLKEPGHKRRTMSTDIISVVLIVYCFIAVWFVGGLSVFHFYLICTNQTTYENFRYHYDRKESPYNLGVIKNFREIFFSKTLPSPVNFREWVTEEDNSVVGTISRKFGRDNLKSNGMIDLEHGITGTDGKTLPNILQNLDYNKIDESSKKRREEKAILDPSFFPTEQEDKCATEDVGSVDDDGTEVGSQRTSSLQCSGDKHEGLNVRQFS